MPLPAEDELRRIQQDAAIDLWGERTAVHWTKLVKVNPYYEPEGLQAILNAGYVEEYASFTTSLDLAFPVDNNAPVGLVFPLARLVKLGYRHLALDQKGVTPMELIYEINGGEPVAIDYLRGVVSYRPKALEQAVGIIRRSGDVLHPIRTKVVPRPRYGTFDFPRQWATEAAQTPYARIVDLPGAAVAAGPDPRRE